MKKIVLLILILVPTYTVHAEVVINEIAWMGTASSASDEWLELANTGESAVDLLDWRLTSASGVPIITLSGTIPANGYFLLERTDDNSVTGITADIIYTGALTNSGTTLTLTDNTGSVIDKVIGGENWITVGGDNVTKETASRTAVGWETTTATPRAKNPNESKKISSPSEDANVKGDSVQVLDPVVSVGGTSSPPEYVPIPHLRLSALENRNAVVRASVSYRVGVYGENGKLRNDANIKWSFGDGTGAVGNGVSHIYYAAGEYRVVVHVTTSDGGEVYKAFNVTVQASGIVIDSVSNEGVSLRNTSAHTVDISYWSLKTGDGGSFVFADNTTITSGNSVMLPPEVTGLSYTGNATLMSSSGEVVETWPNNKTSQLQPSLSAERLSIQATPKKVPPKIEKQTKERHADEQDLAPAVSHTVAAVGAVPESETRSKNETNVPSILTWSLGGILTLSMVAFLFM